MKVLTFGLLLSIILFPYPIESYTEVFSIAKDSNDNTYVVGNRGANFFIGKKSATCELQWESTAGSTSGDDDNDINAEVLYDAIIGQGEVIYAVGSTKGNFSSPLDKVPNLDAAVLVYDPGNGDIVIQKQYDIEADLDNIAQAVTQKADGNLLVAVHGSASNIETSAMYQTRILDIDSQTLDVQRVHEIEVTTTEGLFSLTGGPKLLDFVYEESSDSIIAVGHILGRGILWEYSLTTETTTGQTEWGEVLGNFQISGFTTDGNGAFFVVGSSNERVLENSDLQSAVGSEFHAYVIRYDNLGSSPNSATWIRQLAGAGSSQSGRGIATDPVTGDIVVVGDFDADFTVTDGQTSKAFTVDSIADNGITDVFLWILDAATGDFKGLRSSSVASTDSEDRGNTVSVLSTRTIHIGGITADGNDSGATVCDRTNVSPSPSPSLSSLPFISPSRTPSAAATVSQELLTSSLPTTTASMTVSPSTVPSLSETPKLLSAVPSSPSVPTTSSFQSIVVTAISASPVRTSDAMLLSTLEVSAAPSISLHSNSFSSTFEVLPMPFESPSDIFETAASSSPVLASVYESPILMDSLLTMETAEVQILEATTTPSLFVEDSLAPMVTATETEGSRSGLETSSPGEHDTSEFPSPAIFSNGFTSHVSTAPSFTSGAFPTTLPFSSIPLISSQDHTREGEFSPALSTVPVDVSSMLIPSTSVPFTLVDLGTATPSPSRATVIPSVSALFTFLDLGTATPSSSPLPFESTSITLSTEKPSFIPDFPLVSFESSLGVSPSTALSATVDFISPTPTTGVNSVMPSFETISPNSSAYFSDFPRNIGKDEVVSSAEPDDKDHLAFISTPCPSDGSDENDVGMRFATPDASSQLSVETPEQILLTFEATIEPSLVPLDPFFTRKDGIQEANSTPLLLESSYDGFSESPSAMQSQDPFFRYPMESVLVQTPSVFQVTEFGKPTETPTYTEAEAITAPVISEKFTPAEMSPESNEIYPTHLMPSGDLRTHPTDMLEGPEVSLGSVAAGITSPIPSVNVQDTMLLTESAEEAYLEPSASAPNPLKSLVSASNSPIARESIRTETDLDEAPFVSLLMQTASADTNDVFFSPEESGEVTYFTKPSQQAMLSPSDAYEEESPHENFTAEGVMDEEDMLRPSPSTLQTNAQNLDEDVPILRSDEPEGTHLFDLDASAATTAAVFSNYVDIEEVTPQPSLYSHDEESFDRIHGNDETLTPDPSANIFELLPKSSVAIKDEMEEFDNSLTASEETDINYTAGPTEKEGSPSFSEEDQFQPKGASSSPFHTDTDSSFTGPQPSEEATVMPSPSIGLPGPTFGFGEVPDESFSFPAQSNEADVKQPLPTPFETVSDESTSASKGQSLITPETSFGGTPEQSMEYMLISTTEILPSPSLISSDLDINKENITAEPGDDSDDGMAPTSEGLVAIPSLTTTPVIVVGTPTGSSVEIEGDPESTLLFTNLPFSTPVSPENSGQDPTKNSSGPQSISSTPSVAGSAAVSMPIPSNPPKASESALSPILTPNGTQEGPREPTASAIDIVLASATPSSSPTPSQAIFSATPAISVTVISAAPLVSGLFTSVSPSVSKEPISISPSVRGVTITPNQGEKSVPSDTVSIVLPSATPSSGVLASSNLKPSSTSFETTGSSSPTLPSMSSFSFTPTGISSQPSLTIAPSISVQMNTPSASPSSINNEALSSSSVSQTAGSPEAIMSPSPLLSRGVSLSQAATESALPSVSIQISSRPSSAGSPTSLPSFSTQASSLATSISVPTITPRTSPMVTPSFLPSASSEPTALVTPKLLPSISSQPSSLKTSTSVPTITPEPSPLVTHSFLQSVSPAPPSSGPSTSLPQISSQPSSLGMLTPVPTTTPRPSILVMPSLLPPVSPGPSSSQMSTFLPSFFPGSSSLATPTYIFSTASISEEGEASASLLIPSYTSEDVDPSTSAAVTPSSSEEFDPSMLPSASLLIIPYTSEDVVPSGFATVLPSFSEDIDASMSPFINPSISEDIAGSTFPSMVVSPSRIELETLEPSASSNSMISNSPFPSSSTSPTGECVSIGTDLTDPSLLNRTRNFQRVNMVIQVAGPSLTDSCQFTATIAERFVVLSAINTLSEAEMWYITSVEDGPPVFEEGSSLVIIEQEDSSDNGIARVSPTPSNDSGKRIRFAGSAIFNVTAFMNSLSVALASGPYVEYIDSQNIVKVMTAEGFNDIKWTGMVVGPVIVDAQILDGETRATSGRLSSGEISAIAVGGLLVVGVAVFVIVEGGLSTRRPGPMLPI